MEKEFPDSGNQNSLIVLAICILKFEDILEEEFRLIMGEVQKKDTQILQKVYFSKTP